MVALGVVGFGVALIFAYYSAPDLAITQLLVETLTVVLFMFVVLRLPPLKAISGRLTRVRDALMTTALGGLITIYYSRLLISSSTMPSPISWRR
ncbi:MAG TPA: hypothetical protein DCY38_05210 [Opitutae bacterium]|nr:hypothetical protein [Opitutae bacterium]